VKICLLAVFDGSTLNPKANITFYARSSKSSRLSLISPLHGCFDVEAGDVSLRQRTNLMALEIVG
jgi:hypothetical protein